MDTDTEEYYLEVYDDLAIGVYGEVEYCSCFAFFVYIVIIANK
jgi:hypothetical protein